MFKRLAKELSIKINRSSAYQPKSQGKVKQIQRTFHSKTKDGLTNLVGYTGKKLIEGNTRISVSANYGPKEVL